MKNVKFTEQGSQCTRFKGFTGLLSNLLPFTFFLFLVAVFVAGLFYGILAECDLREFRFSDGWWAWQHDRALAEHYAERVGR